MPLVVTVHDLAVLRRPGVVQPLDAHLLALRRAARRPRRVARDRRLRVHEARAGRRCSPSRRTKIRVVPNAVEDVFTPDGPRGRGRLRARGRDARAAQEPRADRGRGRGRAARRRRARLGQRRAAGEHRARSARSATRSWRALYRGARCLVYASLYEGFGIPVAEALACGCPVVTSAGSAMAEFAGDDATYVDPTDVDSIRDGIARALPAGAAARRVVGRGRPRDRGRVRGARVILLDADVLGRARTGDETLRRRTCCASCPRRRPTCASPR